MTAINELSLRRPTIEEMLDYAKEIGSFRSALDNSTNYFQTLKVIRDYYLKNEGKILDTHRRNPYAWAESYPCDWENYFTPIEFEAWCAIRCKGQLVLYPQYPALNYHLDFGNPGLKIGLELDGKQFHNKQRDIKRDAELNRAGWKIYRITGAEMAKTNYKTWHDINEQSLSDNDAMEALDNWILYTGDGVITAIRYVHFIAPFQTITPDEEEDYEPDMLWNRYHRLCNETLQMHSYKNAL